MGRSIERQDGEDFKRCVSGHFQIGAASDTLTDRQRNGIYQPSISKVSQGTRRALLYRQQVLESFVVRRQFCQIH
jgi:hypothetical protein